MMTTTVCGTPERISALIRNMQEDHVEAPDAEPLELRAYLVDHSELTGVLYNDALRVLMRRKTPPV